MAQLEKIGAVMEQRWSKKKKSRNKEENRDKEERFEDGLRKSQKEGTLLSISY